MAVWALNDKITDPLVVTAGSAVSKSPHGKSRELWAKSGTHFSTDLCRSVKDFRKLRAPGAYAGTKS